MSIKEIAEKSGVSIATVYRVMSQHPSISKETTRRVEEVVQEMGWASFDAIYTRGSKRRSRKGVQAGQVVFLLVGKNLAADFSIVRGMENTLSEYGLKLMFAYAPSFSQIPEAVTKEKIDGVILHGWGFPTPLESEVKKICKCPAVWVMTHEEGWGDCVQPDNAAIGHIAAQYFLRRSYKRLAVLMPESGQIAFEQRAQSFVRTASANQVTTQTYRTDNTTGDTFQEILPEEINRLAAESPLPQGLFVLDDNFVGAIYNMLMARGITPGKDIEIVSCGHKKNNLVGLSPQPVTIDMCMEKIGSQAAKQLIYRLTHRDEDIRTVIMVQPQPLEQSVDANEED